MHAPGSPAKTTQTSGDLFSPLERRFRELARSNGYPAILRHCDDLRNRDGLTTFLTAWRLCAYAAIGEQAKVNELLDLDKLITISAITRDPDQSSGLSFHDAASIIMNEIDLEPPYPFEPICNGLKSGDIFEAGYAACDCIEDTLMTLFLGYIERRRLLAARLEKPCVVKGWVNILFRNGYAGPHYHPGAVLSAVYYPFYESDDDAAESTSEILFGVYPENMCNKHVLPIRRICPEPGMLIMFPSYIGHGVATNVLSRPRLSMAFDLVEII